MAFVETGFTGTPNTKVAIAEEGGQKSIIYTPVKDLTPTWKHGPYKGDSIVDLDEETNTFVHTWDEAEYLDNPNKWRRTQRRQQWFANFGSLFGNLNATDYALIASGVIFTFWLFRNRG